MSNTGYKLLIVYNQIYFYDIKRNNVEIFKTKPESIKYDKIFNLNTFFNDVKHNNKIKKISSKLSGERLEIIYWENYNDADKKLLKDIFNDLNFSLVEFVDIKELLKSNIPNLVLSSDGIHYLSDIGVFYSYESHYFDIGQVISFIKEKNKISSLILISKNIDLSVLDSDVLMYENNKTFFEDLLKM